MRWWSGGKHNVSDLVRFQSSQFLNSITKLMGESFKNHAQALRGYEDTAGSGSGGTTPTMTSPGVDLDMDASFQPIQT